MRRIISVFLVLAFCLSVPLVAFAAEPDEFIFEIMPPVSMLDDYDFLPTADCTGVYEGYFPEDVYYIEIVSPSGVFKLDEPVNVLYDYTFTEETLSFGCYVSFGNYSNCELRIFDTYDLLGFTILQLYFENGSIHLEDGSFFRFSSVDQPVSLTDYVNSDSLSPLLDEIVALLPVVLAVIVGYIALRKAIAWLMSVMRSS